MVIISKGTLKDFAALHPDAIDALNQWYEIRFIGTHKEYDNIDVSKI